MRSRVGVLLLVARGQSVRQHGLQGRSRSYGTSSLSSVEKTGRVPQERAMVTALG